MMTIYDINGNPIGAGAETVLGYERVYTDLTNALTFERKEMTTSGITDSTTHLLVELPNNYNVEVRFSASSHQFAVFRKSSGGTITQLRDYDWWSYCFTPSNSYQYFACIKAIDGSAVPVVQGGVAVRILQWRDIGKNHLVSIPDSLKGKRVAVLGDSIVQGRFCKNGNSVNESMLKPWSNLISEAIGCENANYGVGGALVYNSDIKSLYANCGDVSGFDVVIVCGGTNDYGNNTTAANFQSAFTYVVETLMANNTTVIVATPTVRTNKTGANSRGLTLSDYAVYEKAIAAAKGLSVIDLLTLTDTTEFKSHLSDGLHPDEQGHRIIADLILENA